MDTTIKPSRLADAAGISISYASELLSAKRKPSRRLAIRIYRSLGVKMGPISNVSDADIAVLERLEASAA